MKKKLFLIDGHSFIYRAFYAVRPLSTSKGEPTNAVFGFWTMIRKILEQEKPAGIAVCMDKGEKTFRHEKYELYKADRPEMHEDLIKQLPVIRELLEAHRIPVFEKTGYEADDLLGTLAHKAAENGFEVYIATSDKDALQLVSGQVKIYHAHRDGEIVDEDKVREKLSGLGPKDVVEVMSLMGDSSDQIPGVPGIGEKTAVKLISEFRTLDNLYKHLDKIESEKLRVSLKEHEKDARLSHELATIDCHAPVEFSKDEVLIKGPDEKRLAELLQRLEFRSFAREAGNAPAPAPKKGKRHYVLIEGVKELEELAAKIKKAAWVAVDTETTSTDPFTAELVGVSFSIEKDSGFFVPIKHDSARVIGLKDFKRVMGPVLADERIKKCGQNIKYDYCVLRENDLDLRGIEFDTMIASYLLNPLKLNHNLDSIARERLGFAKIPTSELIGTGKNQITMDRVPIDRLTEYACEDADCVFELAGRLLPELKKHQLERLFFELEMPLVRVLAQMEKNGVAIDTDCFERLSRRAEHELEELTKKIRRIAGEDFNINSPKQLQEILFQKLKLPAGKRGKTGYSTDVSVLEKLAEEHEIARLLLEYRERQKLKSTYLDALPGMLNPKDHLIHTSYNQTVTSTGRLSSSEPNLQNIPIKSELGREIRKGFVPRHKTSRLLSADYSQIELRILAHLSGDPVLSRAFHEDKDVHAYTATLLYGVPEGEVTRGMRNTAKTINFSILYGKTVFGLSRDLGVSSKEAAEFINSYFARYEKVKEFLESLKERARRDGYLTTILGRRSYFPDIASRNVMARQFAERAAVNAPLQGSAADLIKRAMIDIQEALEKRALKTLMVLQVHDELVFDVPAGELEEAKKLVREKMEHALKLTVPLKVDIAVTGSWYKD